MDDEVNKQQKAIQRIFDKYSKNQINYVIPKHREYIEGLETIEQDGKKYSLFSEEIFSNLQKLLDTKSFKSTEPKKISKITTETTVTRLSSNIIRNCDYIFTRNGKNHTKGDTCSSKAACTVTIKGAEKYRCNAHKNRKT